MRDRATAGGATGAAKRARERREAERWERNARARWGEARARRARGGAREAARDFATSRLGVYRGVTLFGRARGGANASAMDDD
jgi:hypothetical protein